MSRRIRFCAEQQVRPRDARHDRLLFGLLDELLACLPPELIGIIVDYSVDRLVSPRQRLFDCLYAHPSLLELPAEIVRLISEYGMDTAIGNAQPLTLLSGTTVSEACVIGGRFLILFGHDFDDVGDEDTQIVSVDLNVDATARLVTMAPLNDQQWVGVCVCEMCSDEYPLVAVGTADGIIDIFRIRENNVWQFNTRIGTDDPTAEACLFEELRRDARSTEGEWHEDMYDMVGGGIDETHAVDMDRPQE